jgi:hypothetical protein
MSLHAWKLMHGAVFQMSDDFAFGDYNPLWYPVENGMGTLCFTVKPFNSLAKKRILQYEPFSERNYAPYAFSTLVDALKSPDFSFITRLVLERPWRQFNMNEMFCLTELKNLGVLELHDFNADIGGHELPTNDRWTDHLIAGWASGLDPFPVLRILVVHSPYCTERSFQYLPAFPSLALFDIGGYGRDWGLADKLAAEVGWETPPGRPGNMLTEMYKCIPVMKSRSGVRRQAQELLGLPFGVNDLGEWWSAYYDVDDVDDNPILRYHCLGEFIHENKDVLARCRESPPDYTCDAAGKVGLPFRPMLTASTRTGRKWESFQSRDGSFRTYLRSAAFRRREGETWDPTRVPEDKTGALSEEKPKRPGPSRVGTLELKARKKQNMGNLLNSFSVGENPVAKDEA